VNLRNIEVKSPDPRMGKKRAKQAVCDCGHDLFVVFQIEGQNHFHLQCESCGSSHCPMGGGCHADEDDDIPF
jgi:hypothetical protein